MSKIKILILSTLLSLCAALPTFAATTLYHDPKTTGSFQFKAQTTESEFLKVTFYGYDISAGTYKVLPIQPKNTSYGTNPLMIKATTSTPRKDTGEVKKLEISTDIDVPNVSDYSMIYAVIEDDITTTRHTVRETDKSRVVSIMNWTGDHTAMNGDNITLSPIISPETVPSSAFSKVEWYGVASSTAITKYADSTAWKKISDGSFDLHYTVADDEPYHAFYANMTYGATGTTLSTPIVCYSPTKAHIVAVGKDQVVGTKLSTATLTNMANLDSIVNTSSKDATGAYTPITDVTNIKNARSWYCPDSSKVQDGTLSDYEVIQGKHTYYFTCDYGTQKDVHGEITLTGTSTTFTIKQYTLKELESNGGVAYPELHGKWTKNQFHAINLQTGAEIPITKIKLLQEGQEITRTHMPLTFEYTNDQGVTNRVTIYADANYVTPYIDDDDNQVISIVAVLKSGTLTEQNIVDNDIKSLTLNVTATHHDGTQETLTKEEYSATVRKSGNKAIVTVMHAQCTSDVVVDISG